MSGKLVVTICKARHLIPCDVGGTSDPFVVLTMGNVTKRTKVASSTLHPTWDETFVFQGTRKKIGLTLQIFDKDLIGSSDFMGMVQLDFDADRAYTMVGEAWLPLHERRGKNIDSAKQKNYGEIYVRWWYRFNQLGNIMLAGNISDDSKANADIPSLNMTILKTGIARATAALFGCLQPYYWMMRLFVWESLSSSFISLYVISWLWWHGKLHTLLPMLLTGTMIMNFIRFYRWGPDGKVSPQRQSSNSLTDTLDWYRETLHRAQLLTGRVADVGDRIAKIFSWGFPGTSLKVLRICFSILLISVLGIMPTSSFLFFIALLYLFTIYSLSCNFPNAYAILLAREFKTRIETSVLKDGNVSDGDSDGDVNVKYVLETNATELRNEETPVWVDKNKKLRCRTCGVSFGLVNRRKHCRSCGDVYCGKCCLVVSLDKVPFFVTSGNVKKARICNVCIAILVNHTMLWRGGIQVDILGGSLSLKTRVSMLIHNWRPLKNPKMTISLGDVCQILNYEIVTFTRSDMPNQYLLETRSVRYTLTLVDPDATRVHADALMALLT